MVSTCRREKEQDMRAALLIGALTLVLVRFVAVAQPAIKPMVLYVATTGSDARSGKLAAPTAARTDGPLATLAGARDVIRKLKANGGLGAPVTVLVQTGIYRLSEPVTLEPQDSDTAECPITYKAAPGAKPVISGGRAIAGWKEQSKGLWVANVPEAKERKWPFRELWVNGWRATLARSPNEGHYRIVGQAAPLVDSATGKERDYPRRAFRFGAGDLKQWNDVAGANVVVFFWWETATLRIRSVDETTNTVTFTGDMKWPFWGGQRYYVENVFAALDAPGEWYLDSDAGEVYYRPRPGEDMSKAAVVAPVLTELVRFAGNPDKGGFVEHLHFEGLSFQHCGYVLEPEGHSDAQAEMTVPAAIQADGARHCSVERCEIAHLGPYGIWFRRGCKDNRVVADHLHDLGAGGVRIGECPLPPSENVETSRNEVSSNFIHDLGKVFHGAIGVWVGQSDSNVIAHNEIRDLSYTAISCGWQWGYGPSKAHHNRIEYNHLHHVGPGKLCDMGGIYLLGVSPGTVIRGNLIHDIWDVGWDGIGASGIYPDEGSSNLLIENNVVYRTASGGLAVHYGKDNVAVNNIFALGRDDQVCLGRSDKESSLKFERNIVYYDEGKRFVRDPSLEADNNVYWNSKGGPVTFLIDLTLDQWRAKGLDVHSVIADPQFVDAKKDDYRLKDTSPAFKLGFEEIDLSKVGPRRRS